MSFCRKKAQLKLDSVEDCYLVLFNLPWFSSSLSCKDLLGRFSKGKDQLCKRNTKNCFNKYWQDMWHKQKNDVDAKSSKIVPVLESTCLWCIYFANTREFHVWAIKKEPNWPGQNSWDTGNLALGQVVEVQKSILSLYHLQLALTLKQRRNNLSNSSLLTFWFPI